MPYRPSRLSRIRSRDAGRLDNIDEADFRHFGFTKASLKALSAALRGKLVLPDNPDYEQDRQESNPAFQSYPVVIVYCKVPNDVRLCLEFRKRWNIPVACRSGGHSTAGYSVNEGLVLDTSQLSFACVAPDRQSVTVGAGTNFGDLNSELNEYQLHVPGGACEDVCVAGYMQGGGYGYTQRLFGLNSDNVTGIRMMLHDGHIVIANDTQNTDLFWAVRGGTGGNFGVLLDITYKAHSLNEVWGFAWVWDINDAAALMEKLQKDYMRTGDRRLGYMANLASHQPKDSDTDQRVFVLQGVFIGPKSDAHNCLEPLKQIATPVQMLETVKPYDQLDNWLDNNPYPIPNLPNTGAYEDKQAGYIASPMTRQQWQSVVDFYLTTPCRFNTVVLEPYGGAINSYPVDKSAFIHRDVDTNFFVDVFWFTDSDGQPDAAQREEAKQWLDKYMQYMQQFFNGHVYQNYPRATLTEYRSMYFGRAFEGLLKVKAKYDPHNFFEYQQSIKPYPEGTSPPQDSTQNPITPPGISDPIVYECQ
ncbi:MAG: FAD-binding protein [Pseudomonadota bacterium]